MKLLHSNIINAAFQYVINTSKKHNIDESHALKHSMDVFHYANKIVHAEFPNNRFLEQQADIISVSAIVHDMCDKKYVDKDKQLQHIEQFLGESLPPNEIKTVQQIIATMPYSYITEHGFPELCEYQDAYHIVREADLLTAYDFDRSMLYHLHGKGRSSHTTNLTDAYLSAEDFFTTRAFKHNDNGLFTTKYAKEKSVLLHEESFERMMFWKTILDKE